MALAQRYSASFLDTGLTFRAIALLCDIEREVAPENLAGIWRRRIVHQVAEPPEFRELIRIDGCDVTADIFNYEADIHLDDVAKSITLRSEILSYHEALLTVPRTIAAGRDVSLSLLADAHLHVYLTADYKSRRMRRRQQTLTMPDRSIVVGCTTSLDCSVQEELEKRTNMVRVDTSQLTPDAVLDLICERISRRSVI
ncbi:(d)CMP kinase [Candidatus Poriferisodalis sp.]|uniref:(d)CMP kinase n=1 Tax=Candidatus Poriferisodalis sp. TaxID=3101277 RepID=UPI003B52A90B